MLARFDRWEADPRGVTLVGPSGRLRVTSPAPGVVRVCLATPALEGEKRPWALEGPPPERPLEARALPRGVEVRGEGVRCEIQLDPLRWTFGEAGDPAGVALSGCWIGEERRWAAEPHLRPLLDTGEEGSPVLTAALDGRVVGHGVSLLLPAPPGRHYYGLGERAGWLDRRGRRWTVWATDTSPILPTTDALYLAVPFLLHVDAGRSAGILVDESWRSVFDLGATDPETVLVRVEGPSADLYLIAGPDPREVLDRYTALTGRPPLPPLWALGYHQSRWSYRSADEVRRLVGEFRRRRIPLDVVHLDIDHMDGYRVFTWDPVRFPDPAGLARDLRREGVRLVVISEPSLAAEPGYRPYEEARARGFLVRDGRGEVYRGEVWTAPAVLVDFLQPEARAWWGRQFRELLDAGIAGVWNDMNEPTVRGTPGLTLPLDARLAGRTHLELHNVYGLHHTRATWEGLRFLRPEERPFVLTRSGFAGIQRYAAVWTGDNSSWWEQLEGSIPMLLNLGLSGVSFVGADIGGFHGNAEGELLVRWTQLGVFYPLMRNHTIRGSRRQEPWAFGPEVERLVREAIELRYAVLPYLYTLLEEAASRGLPPMRPLLLHYPEDPETYHLGDEFLWGRDLLVAPALRPGSTHRAVYLPAGRWADWWTGEVRAGPAWAVVGTPLDRIPLFLREGGAVPLTSPRPHTPERAVWEDLEWRVFPPREASTSEAVEGRLYEDDGRTPRERLREWAVTTLRGVQERGRLLLRCATEGGLVPERREVRVRLYGAGTGWEVLSPAGAAASEVEGQPGCLLVTLPQASAPWEAVVRLGG